MSRVQFSGAWDLGLGFGLWDWGLDWGFSLFGRAQGRAQGSGPTTHCGRRESRTRVGGSPSIIIVPHKKPDLKGQVKIKSVCCNNSLISILRLTISFQITFQ